MTIVGPCFESTDDVRVRFGDAEVQATVVDDTYAKCIAPFRGSRGKVDLEVSLDGGSSFVYRGEYIYGEK